jgi:hypothetical protein
MTGSRPISKRHTYNTNNACMPALKAMPVSVVSQLGVGTFRSCRADRSARDVRRSILRRDLRPSRQGYLMK